MTEFNRKAGVLWTGDLENGSGLISTESRALYESPYNFQTRFGNATGLNPEELIAAAHAACFSMALANILKRKGYTPVQTEANATCTMRSRNGAFEITSILLHVRGQVPGIDAATFKKYALDAHKECPVSKILRDGLEIKIDADLIEA
jgi:osmotically inducible protein OsmC